MIAPRPPAPPQFETLPRFIGLLRRDGAIMATLSVLREPLPYQIPEPDLRPYELTETPLDELDKGLFANKSRVQKAWAELAQVSDPSPDTLANIMIILLETQLDSSITTSEPALPNLKPTMVDTKPTAAHPRAFKGTKTKPPKSAVVSHNLQPLLFSERGVNYLLEHLYEHKRNALVQLKKLGYTDSQLNSVADHKVKAPPADQDSAYTAAMARLASFEPKSGMTAWAKLLATRPEEQRISLVVTSITAEATKLEISRIQTYLETLDCLCEDDEELIKAFWVLMDAIENGHDDEYVLHGFRIQKAMGKPMKFTRIENSVKNLDWQLILKIDAATKISADGDEYWPKADGLWADCGETLHMAPLLPKLLAANLHYKVFERFVSFIRYSHYLDNDPAKVINGKRNVAAKYASALLQAVVDTDPSYRLRCVNEMQDYFYMADSAECVDKNMNGFIALLPRLCTPPFSPKLDLAGTACGYIEIFGIQIVAEAPDKALLALEAQCNSTQGLVTSALFQLCESFPDLAKRSLYTNTTKLCKVAKLFGTVPIASKRNLINQLKKHPLMQDLERLNLQELFEVVRPFVGSDVASPFSAKMTACLTGDMTLTDEQKERGHKVAQAKLDGTRLDIMRRLAFNLLTAEVPIDLLSENTLHAMQIYNRSKNNRRAFKSFLKAHFNGRPDYRENHPLSRKWLAEHAKLDADLFREGIVLCEEVEGFGKVTITVEQDPFEALKLGTYVNSCFSMNGLCNYSALAVVLDINKRVVYARDARGKVLARQIVVWDEEDWLEAFRVYPEKIKRPIKQFFRKYDLAFAKALNTEVYSGDSYGDGVPAVVNILSNCWWDDGSWDASELLDEVDNDDEDDF